MYACLSVLSLGLTPTKAYSNAARDTKVEQVMVYAVSIAPTMTTVFVSSFLILFIKAS